MLPTGKLFQILPKHDKYIFISEFLVLIDRYFFINWQSLSYCALIKSSFFVKHGAQKIIHTSIKKNPGALPHLNAKETAEHHWIKTT